MALDCLNKMTMILLIDTTTPGMQLPSNLSVQPLSSRPNPLTPSARVYVESPCLVRSDLKKDRGGNSSMELEHVIKAGKLSIHAEHGTT